MANTDLFLALPKYATGASVISSATAWAYGSYVVIAECLARDIYIIGVQFQITDAPASLDVTEEHLFESPITVNAVPSERSNSLTESGITK